LAEEAIFNALSLQASQQIEEYHALVMDRGSRLQKTDRDMLHRFVAGLPAQLAFFVRAGRVDSLREALHVAKIGEAHGYRTVTQLTTAAVGKPSDTKLPDHQSNKRGPKICFKCDGPHHIKPKCNWTGEGMKSPGVRCQLCDQFGHTAKSCLTNPRHKSVTLSNM
jgi:hypothetical protein